MLLNCSNFQKLSPNLKKRLAVENDDKASQWSIADLMPLHDRIGIPLLTQAGCLLCAHALMGCSVTQNHVWKLCRAACPAKYELLQTLVQVQC